MLVLHCSERVEFAIDFVSPFDNKKAQKCDNIFPLNGTEI